MCECIQCRMLSISLKTLTSATVSPPLNHHPPSYDLTAQILPPSQHNIPINSRKHSVHKFSSDFVLEMDLFFGPILAIECCSLCFGHNIDNQQTVYSYSVHFTFTIRSLFVLYVYSKFELWFGFVFEWPSLRAANINTVSFFFVVFFLLLFSSHSRGLLLFVRLLLCYAKRRVENK